MARINVLRPSFLARDDLPPVALPLQRILLEAVAVPEEEIASSRLSLEEEIDKFYFEEEGNQGAPVVNVSDIEDGTNRHLGVQAPIWVIARPDSSSEEEEEGMALNKGNKSLKDLLATKNKAPTPKEATKSQAPPTLPPPPLLPTNLGLKAIPDLKKKRPVQELKEEEVGPQKGTKQQKVTKDPRDKRSSFVDSWEEKNKADVHLP